MNIRSLDRKPLLLRGWDRLTLLFTGTGSAFAAENYQTNLLILKGDDHVMVDFGTRAPAAVRELGLVSHDLDTFLITHSHADHIGGLEEVLLLSRYVKRRKPRFILTEEYERILWEMSLRGGLAYNEGRRARSLQPADFWDTLRPEPLGGFSRQSWNIRIGGIDLKLFRTMHIPDSAVSWQDSFWSCGLVIDDRVLFTGDTRFDPDLLRELDARFRLETIFHDCQLRPPGGVHAALDEIATLSPSLKERMYLVHYQDDFEKYRDTVASNGFAGFGKPATLYGF